MTKHSYFPYMSAYSSSRHNTNRKHNIHHTPTQTYNILQHSKAKQTLSLTTVAAQQPFPPTPHNPTTDIKVWWTTSGKIGLPPLVRVMGVSEQQWPRKILNNIFMLQNIQSVHIVVFIHVNHNTCIWYAFHK